MFGLWLFSFYFRIKREKNYEIYKMLEKDYDINKNREKELIFYEKNK